jgi:hypothetical protein
MGIGASQRSRTLRNLLGHLGHYSVQRVVGHHTFDVNVKRVTASARRHPRRDRISNATHSRIVLQWKDSLTL